MTTLRIEHPEVMRVQGTDGGKDYELMFQRGADIATIILSPKEAQEFFDCDVKLFSRN